MLISPKHLPPNVSEQLSNEEVASALFPKIMDKSYQAPHDANSGWCQYIRPNGASFWVYVDDHGAVCIQTEAVRNATNMTIVDADFDIHTLKNEFTCFLEQIAPWLLDCDFKQSIIQSSQSVSLFFLENNIVRWIFRVWGAERWSLGNAEYEYM